jgi:hypothetical protein
VLHRIYGPVRQDEEIPGKHRHELYSSLLMGDQIREGKNGRICVINSAHEKCKENSYWKICRNSFGIS